MTAGHEIESEVGLYVFVADDTVVEHSRTPTKTRKSYGVPVLVPFSILILKHHSNKINSLAYTVSSGDRRRRREKEEKKKTEKKTQWLIRNR